jgi:putative membrane protein
MTLIAATPAGRSKMPRWLLASFAVLWLALAWHPLSRQDWLLENLLVLCTLPWLLDCYFRRPFSLLSYACFWLFFSLHSVGAHFTYSLVPYDAAWRSVFGFSLDQSLGFTRNNYDRLVHFMYGLLLAAPATEVVARNTRTSGFALWSATVLFMTAHSAIYEMIEWLAAAVFGGDLGQAYVGSQGDNWDSQKDMALLSLGALIGATAYTMIARRRQRRGS